MTSGVDSGEKTFHPTSGNECKFSSDSKARGKKRRHHLQLIHQYSISIQLGKKVELTAKTPNLSVATSRVGIRWCV